MTDFWLRLIILPAIIALVHFLSFEMFVTAMLVLIFLEVIDPSIGTDRGGRDE